MNDVTQDFDELSEYQFKYRGVLIRIEHIIQAGSEWWWFNIASIPSALGSRIQPALNRAAEKQYPSRDEAEEVARTMAGYIADYQLALDNAQRVLQDASAQYLSAVTGVKVS